MNEKMTGNEQQELAQEGTVQEAETTQNATEQSTLAPQANVPDPAVMITDLTTQLSTVQQEVDTLKIENQLVKDRLLEIHVQNEAAERNVLKNRVPYMMKLIDLRGVNLTAKPDKVRTDVRLAIYRVLSDFPEFCGQSTSSGTGSLRNHPRLALQNIWGDISLYCFRILYRVILHQPSGSFEHQPHQWV